MTVSDKIDQWIWDHMKAGIFLFENRPPIPGDRVLETDTGRVGRVVEGIVDYSCAIHPTIIYDDDKETKNTTYNIHHFRVFEAGSEYGEGVFPITW